MCLCRLTCCIPQTIISKYRYTFLPPPFKFTPNDTVPGQNEQALTTFLALGLQPHDIDQMFSIFLRIDTDGSGSISVHEFYNYFNIEQSPFSDQAFTILDEDKSGEIDFREFVFSLWNYCSYDFKALCHFAFLIFDEDRSGALEIHEVTQMVMSVYGDKFVGDVRIQRVLDHLDKDKDGRISVAEWLLFNRKYPLLLFPAFKIQKKLRTNVMGEWWWDIIKTERDGKFENRNIFDILESIEKDNMKFGNNSNNHVTAEMSVNIENSSIRRLQSSSMFKSSNSSIKPQLSASEYKRIEVVEREEKERKLKFTNLPASMKRVEPMQQSIITEVEYFNQSNKTDQKGRGKKGYDLGATTKNLRENKSFKIVGGRRMKALE